MKLRSAGFSANFSYKITKLSKQLKQASEQNAAKCIIIGDEFKDNKLTVKDMATGQQEPVDADEFLSSNSLRRENMRNIWRSENEIS